MICTVSRHGGDRDGRLAILSRAHTHPQDRQSGNCLRFTGARSEWFAGHARRAVDHRSGAGKKAYLVTYEGKVLRSFETEKDKSSGITFDGEALWIRSTYSRKIVRCIATTGKALERHFTPGARDLQDGRRSSGPRESAGEVQAEACGAAGCRRLGRRISSR